MYGYEVNYNDNAVGLQIKNLLIIIWEISRKSAQIHFLPLNYRLSSLNSRALPYTKSTNISHLKFSFCNNPIIIVAYSDDIFNLKGILRSFRKHSLLDIASWEWISRHWILGRIADSPFPWFFASLHGALREVGTVNTTDNLAEYWNWKSLKTANYYTEHSYNVFFISHCAREYRTIMTKSAPV